MVIGDRLLKNGSYLYARRNSEIEKTKANFMLAEISFVMYTPRIADNNGARSWQQTISFNDATTCYDFCRHSNAITIRRNIDLHAARICEQHCVVYRA